jgi:hypothetical protein
MTKDQLTTFIQNTLGCDCPEDVLADISSEVHLSGGPLYDTLAAVDSEIVLLVDRMVSVGGRLLVIITRTVDVDVVRKLLAGGVDMRDSLGYNRLRLVVFGSEPEFLSMDTLLNPYDDRVHLQSLLEG